MYVSRFQSLVPPYVVPQDKALNWLAKAHSAAGGEIEPERFNKLFHRYGCAPPRVDQRASFLRDFLEESSEGRQMFRAGREDISIDERTAFFQEVLQTPVETLYPESEPDFKNWIHVTCTGYSSPSVIQKAVSHKGWGDRVECLHAYHMGCYASLPALRIARGNLPCEILHTELCTLHFDPANHDPEQMVIQSLFADGVIRYRVSSERPERGFEVLELKEVIASESLGHMTWAVSAQGFKMTLAREVPKLVQGAIEDLVMPWRSTGAVYAIHPGGPRIIDAVAEALQLSEEQVWFSREILRLHGNMSSATLPHVWQMMMHEIPPGTPVISMAFGPGLTLSASLMRKV